LLDFIAYKPDSQFWFIEVKNGNKKLTKEENTFFIKHAERSVVIRSLDDAIAFLKQKRTVEAFAERRF
jgi:hypothetical protein